MENDISNDIEYIIECIQKYMEGNKEYKEIIDVVVDALNEFKRLNIRNTLAVRLILFMSRLRTYIKCRGLFKESEYQATLEQFNEDFEFYLNSQEQLIQYIRVGTKTNHFPDLDIAYILYLQLSFLYRGIIDYFSYIRKLEDNYINGFESYDTAISKPSIDKETIKNLLPFIEIKI